MCKSAAGLWTTTTETTGGQVTLKILVWGSLERFASAAHGQGIVPPLTESCPGKIHKFIIPPGSSSQSQPTLLQNSPFSLKWSPQHSKEQAHLRASVCWGSNGESMADGSCCPSTSGAPVCRFLLLLMAGVQPWGHPCFDCTGSHTTILYCLFWGVKEKALPTLSVFQDKNWSQNEANFLLRDFFFLFFF